RRGGENCSPIRHRRATARSPRAPPPALNLSAGRATRRSYAHEGGSMRLTKGVGVLAAAGCCTLAIAGGAEALSLHSVDPVPGKQTGVAVPMMLARGLDKVIVAQGSDPLDGGTKANPYYGYDGDGPMLPAPGDVPSDGHQVEATKTEPDKNT